MKKIKLFLIILSIPLFLCLTSCNQAIFARMWGTIGVGVDALYADIGFDGFNYSSSGTGESFQLVLLFDNLAGEYNKFTLKPANSSGSDLSSKYPVGQYDINGTGNLFEGQIAVGTGIQQISSTMGTLIIEVLNFSNGEIIAFQGTYDLVIEGGGSVNGSFSYQVGTTQ